jgi:flagellar export protein FliJ
MFHFSLQQVLDYRSEIQGDCEREFYRAQQELNQALEVHVRLVNERMKVARQMADKLAEGASLDFYLLCQTYLNDLKERIERKQVEVSRLEEIAEQRRQVLVEAMREVETMEQLRKQELEEYAYQERKDEEKAMNDVAIFSFNRGRRERISEQTAG